MTKNIEVEHSGPLTNKQAKKMMSFFDEYGKKITTKHRVLIDYSTFLGDGLKNRKKDIRLRITNGEPEIIVKLGDWTSSNHRKELSVFLSVVVLILWYRFMLRLVIKKVCFASE